MKKLWLRVLTLCLPCLVVLNVTGCVLVPFVQAFKETGVTEGDRMALLPPQVKKFSDARVFGNKREALTFVSSDARNDISKQLNSNDDQERVVKSQIDDIEWSDDAYKARVVVKVDSFRMSRLIVETVTEEQHWEFTTAGGWLLTQRKKLEG